MATQGRAPDEQQLKQRAMRRLGIALTLIALAIAGLALLDRYNASLKKAEVARGPVEPRVLPNEPAMPAPRPPESTQAEAIPSERAQPAPPKRAEVPVTPNKAREPPPPPVVSNEPLTAAEPARPAPKAIAPVPEAAQPPAKSASPAPAPEKAAAVGPPAPKGTTPPVSTKTQEVPPAKGFVVQVGVFGTAENAKDLQAKLAEKGIPSSTETRVVAGPFKDRSEADAVNARLKEMGLQGMVVAPR